MLFRSPVDVYTGTITVDLPDAPDLVSSESPAIEVRYQPCDDRACRAPQVVQLLAKT